MAAATRGRFWALSDDCDGDELSDDEETTGPERTPPTATLADAFLCAQAKEKRSKQRKGRKAELEIIAERIKAAVARKAKTLSAAALPFSPRAGKIPAIVDGRTPGGIAIRIGFRCFEAGLFRLLPERTLYSRTRDEMLYGRRARVRARRR